MAYKKKTTPRAVKKLQYRLKQVQHLEPHFDWQPEQLVADSEQHIASVEETIKDYNEKLAEADALRDTLQRQVEQACELHVRLRMTVIGTFGRHSRAYRMIGGVPPSEIDYSRNGGGDEA